MALRLSNYQYGSKRRPSEGLRLGSTRLLPRGVKKENYAAQDYMDVWLPTLAPSRELLRWAHAHDLQDPKVWKTYAKRYRTEMGKTDARQTIRTLAEVAKRTPISVGCYCKTPNCHRFELEKLLRAAAGDDFPEAET